MGQRNESDGGQTVLHRPVMCEEVLRFLDPRPGQHLLDLTTGTGGHSILIGRYLGRDGLIVGMDADASALVVARERVRENTDCRVRLFQGHFSEADEVLKMTGTDGFNLIIADLGLGTHQLDDPARGFSFESDAEPDMRFDAGSGRSAAEVVNAEPEESLADIFFSLGQERYSRQIASEIVRRRRIAPIKTAGELAAIAIKVYAARSAGKRWRIHPATRIFMALRMYVNAELEELDMLLDLLPGLALPGCRAGVITYHSLEARRVKEAWRKQAKEGCLVQLTGKPLTAGEKEVRENPRARSAQLRTARFGG